MSSVDTWLAAFRTQAASLPGAGLPWLAEIRRRAVERFADEGWPTHRMENYRHTSLAFLGQQRYVVPAAASRSGQAPHAMLEQLRADDASGHWLVFVDGAFAASLSSIGALPSGAQLGALSEVLARSPERVQAAFGSAEDGASPVALNAALAAKVAQELPRRPLGERPRQGHCNI